MSKYEVLHIKLPKEIYEKIKTLGQEEKRSCNNVGRLAIEFYLKARKKI